METVTQKLINSPIKKLFMFVLVYTTISGFKIQHGDIQLFAPGIISTGGRETGITFSKDGKHCLFTRWALDFSKAEIFESFFVDDKWTEPRLTSFSGEFKDQHPQFSPDGKSVYFISQRPLDKEGFSKDYDIWKVDYSTDGWSEPQNLGPEVNSPYGEYSPSITSDHVLYFSSQAGRIFKSQRKRNTFSKRELIKNNSINTNYKQWHVYVSPDEKLLFFTSLNEPNGKGQEDLYVARKVDDRWSEITPFKYNDFDHDYLATLSPDGKFLYFTSIRYPEGSTEFAAGDVPQNGQPDIYRVLLESVL